ncbi:MAG: hypothetical protein CM1200mP2_11920 [Planctomycetaceae bacterium]|nr:MAG: hypothetical protein CM1200mP2_11920 [Planctomycetaceae bacterium]
MNSYASGTPASDGTRVFVLFTTNDDTVVRAYKFAGKPLWQTDVGRFYNQHGHGCGTSPIVWKDTVIVASQHDGPSVIAGLDAATGKVRWRSERKVRLTAHSTPVILEREGKTPQLFTSNTGDGLASFDPRNGKLLWRANLFKSRAVNSPVVAGGLVMAITGGGGRGKELSAVLVDQQGEVTTDKVVWSGMKNLPYVPTPLAFGDHLYFWCDNGVVSCLEAKTGKAVWTEGVWWQVLGQPDLCRRQDLQHQRQGRGGGDRLGNHVQGARQVAAGRTGSQHAGRFGGGMFLRASSTSIAWKPQSRTENRSAVFYPLELFCSRAVRTTRRR